MSRSIIRPLVDYAQKAPAISGFLQSHPRPTVGLLQLAAYQLVAQTTSTRVSKRINEITKKTRKPPIHQSPVTDRNNYQNWPPKVTKNLLKLCKEGEKRAKRLEMAFSLTKCGRVEGVHFTLQTVRLTVESIVSPPLQTVSQWRSLIRRLCLRNLIALCGWWWPTLVTCCLSLFSHFLLQFTVGSSANSVLHTASRTRRAHTVRKCETVSTTKKLLREFVLLGFAPRTFSASSRPRMSVQIRIDVDSVRQILGQYYRPFGFGQLDNLPSIRGYPNGHLATEWSALVSKWPVSNEPSTNCRSTFREENEGRTRF